MSLGWQSDHTAYVDNLVRHIFYTEFNENVH